MAPHLRGSRASSGPSHGKRHSRWTSRLRLSCRAWLTDPRTGRGLTFLSSRRPQIGSDQLRSSINRLHRVRSAGRHRWSHQRVAPNACPLATHTWPVCVICLLLQSAQPRLASADIECVILALSSLPGTIGQNFLRLRRAEALHLILLIHRGPGPPLSREAAGFDTRSVAHVCR